jgi:hypothetical protein
MLHFTNVVALSLNLPKIRLFVDETDRQGQGYYTSSRECMKPDEEAYAFYDASVR